MGPGAIGVAPAPASSAAGPSWTALRPRWTISSRASRTRPRSWSILRRRVWLRLRSVVSLTTAGWRRPGASPPARAGRMPFEVSVRCLPPSAAGRLEVWRNPHHKPIVPPGGIVGDPRLRRLGEVRNRLSDWCVPAGGAARGHREVAIFGARMRTLVISDLHLGTRLGRDVLRSPEPLEALLEAVAAADRLVLLGDVVELLEGRATRAMEIAAPVVGAIGARLGRDREALLVPSNHDAPLVRPYLRAHGGPATVDAAIPRAATHALEALTRWLAPASVRVHYPGVWLADGVWATHGHYLDLHLLPESGYGIARGLLGRLPRDGAVPAEYERPGVPRVTRAEALMTRWLPRPLAAAADDVAELLRAATMAGLTPRRGLRLRLAPLIAGLLGAQMRHASLPALARVVHRLGVGAEHVVFGHVHRLGPLPGDAPRRWRGPGGRPLMANTGSWTYEPLLLHPAAPPPPYLAGGAALIEDGGEPRALGLLQHLDAAAPPPPYTRAGSRAGGAEIT